MEGPLLLYETLNHSRTCFPSPPLSLYGSLKSVHVILHAVVRCVVRMGGNRFVSCFYYVHLCTSSMCGEQCMSIAVSSVWWIGHWTMKGVVSGGSRYREVESERNEGITYVGQGNMFVYSVYENYTYVCSVSVPSKDEV